MIHGMIQNKRSDKIRRFKEFGPHVLQPDNEENLKRRVDIQTGRDFYLFSWNAFFNPNL